MASYLRLVAHGVRLALEGAKVLKVLLARARGGIPHRVVCCWLWLCKEGPGGVRRLATLGAQRREFLVRRPRRRGRRHETNQHTTSIAAPSLLSHSLSLVLKPQDFGKCLRKKITRDYSRIIIHNRSNIHNIHNRSLECLHNLDLCQIAAVKLRRDPVNGHLKMGCRNLQRYSQLQTSEQTLFFSLSSSVQWVLC